MEAGTMSDCPICLQPLLQPVEVPCGHIFCYLCIKGSAFHGRRCPLCRRVIDINFFDNPNLINELENTLESRCSPQFLWYYEGRNGWWQYDERTTGELELAYAESLPQCEVFIAGHLYIVDFINMCQYRKDHSGRSRRIKRDTSDMSKKGIAGIRLSLLQPSEARDDPEDTGNGGTKTGASKCVATTTSSGTDSPNGEAGATAPNNPSSLG